MVQALFNPQKIPFQNGHDSVFLLFLQKDTLALCPEHAKWDQNLWFTAQAIRRAFPRFTFVLKSLLLFTPISIKENKTIYLPILYQIVRRGVIWVWCRSRPAVVEQHRQTSCVWPQSNLQVNTLTNFHLDWKLGEFTDVFICLEHVGLKCKVSKS